MESNLIFDPADVIVLERSGHIKPVDRRRHQISESLFSSGLSLSENSTTSGIPPTTSISVPEYLESVESLEFIGFDTEKAAQIWRQWVAVEEFGRTNHTFEHSFIEYALTAIPELDDGLTDGNTQMISWGISAELREAIMDPDYANIMFTESVNFWVKDTMEIRFLSLERLQRESSERARNTNSQSA
jgi:hypothetical protein